MRTRHVVGGALAAAVVLGATAAFLFGSGGGNGGPGAGSPSGDAPAVASAPPDARAREAAVASAPAADARPLPPLPASLRGVEVAGGLPVDAEGHLVVVPAVLELFDFYLAATGEEPLAVIRARIEAAIDARLGPPARAEAHALLRDYLAYRESVRALAEGGGADLPLERRFQRLRELRRAHFGDAHAEALFAGEEARTRVDLARRRVAKDSSLTEAERAARLEALEAELPPEVRETRAAVRAATQLREAEARLREEGAGPAEIRALRERRLGPEGAERLAELDARRRAFQARYDAYRRERAALLAEPFESEAARQRGLEALRAARFEGPERRRVEALDGIRAGSAD